MDLTLIYKPEFKKLLTALFEYVKIHKRKQAEESI